VREVEFLTLQDRVPRCETGAGEAVESVRCWMIQTLLSFSQITTHPGPMLIGPGCLYSDAAQMSVSGFRNSAALDAVPAGEFAGHQTAVSHQLTRIGEARQDAELGDNADGRQRMRLCAAGFLRLQRNPRTAIRDWSLHCD
jgi:hypothetical protein